MSYENKDMVLILYQGSMVTCTSERKPKKALDSINWNTIFIGKRTIKDTFIFWGFRGSLIAIFMIIILELWFQDTNRKCLIFLLLFNSN